MAQRTLEEDLAEADRHIAEEKARMARQSDLITRLAAKGRSTTQAEAKLNVLKDSLTVMETHRQLILKMIASGP